MQLPSPSPNGGRGHLDGREGKRPTGNLIAAVITLPRPCLGFAHCKTTAASLRASRSYQTRGRSKGVLTGCSTLYGIFLSSLQQVFDSGHSSMDSTATLSFCPNRNTINQRAEAAFTSAAQQLFDSGYSSTDIITRSSV